MNGRTAIDTKGREFELTEAEEKVVRAIERLEKMDFGRLKLFGSGKLDIRINGSWYENSFQGTSISCEGGDGGD